MASQNQFLDYQGAEKLLILIREQMILAGHQPPDLITDPVGVIEGAAGIPTGDVLYKYTGGVLSNAISVNGSLYSFVNTTMDNKITQAVADGGWIFSEIKRQIDEIPTPPEMIAISDQELEDLVHQVFSQ